MLERIERHLLRKSFVDFIREAWPHLEQESYAHGWHVDVLANHLQAVAHKRIRKLYVNIPPGCSKSNIIMVLYPAWKWTWCPDAGFLCQTYSKDLTLRDAAACRRLIESDWYQARWPEVKFHSDDNAKGYYRTVGGGYRLSTIVGGRVTGEHPTDVLCDDPVSVDDGENASVCQEWQTWFQKTVSTRGVARRVCHVIAQQRVGVTDPTSFCEAQNKQAVLEEREPPWHALVLPMRYDPEIAMADRGYGGDQRSKEGELLFPQIHDEEKVRDLEYALGPLASKTQLGQRPQKRLGKLLKTEKITYIEPDQVPDCELWVRFWDKAATKDAGCNTAGVLLGIRRAGKNSFHYIFRDVAKGQWDTDEVEDKIENYANLDTTLVPKSKYIVGVEREGGSGGKFSVNATKKRLREFRVIDIPPVGTKLARADALAVAMGFGEVFVVRGAFSKPFVDELTDAPDGPFMDQFDAAAHAVNLANEQVGKVGGAIVRGITAAPRKLCRSANCARPVDADKEYCCQVCEIHASFQDGTACQDHSGQCNGRYFDYQQKR